MLSSIFCSYHVTLGTFLQHLHVNYPIPWWHQAPDTSRTDSSHSLFGQLDASSSRLDYILFYYKLDPKHRRCFMKCSSFPDCNENQKHFQPSTESMYSNERHASFHAFLAMYLCISYLSCFSAGPCAMMDSTACDEFHINRIAYIGRPRRRLYYISYRDHCTHFTGS